MIIVENITNVESVLYTDLGDKCPFAVQQKILFNSFLNCECAVISIGSEKYEAYKVFHYNYRKYNDCYVSYSVFEFQHSRKKEFVLRIVVWDRIRNAEGNQTNEGADLCIESDVYYLSGEQVRILKRHLRKLSQVFSKENKYVYKDTDYLEQEVFLDISGVEKIFRWRSPSFNECIQTALGKAVSCIGGLLDGLEQKISSVEFVFENCSTINEARLLRKQINYYNLKI